MNELHLFAGAGGGILGGILLGHTPVCAVEIEPYCRKVLLQRQRDGILPKFPIWDDVTTFDGTPWRGKVDVVCGGFPCQDISIAGGGLELKENGADSGQKWPESLAKYDRNSRSWRTAQCLLFEVLGESLETFPNWGIMRGGECWEQTTLELVTKGKDFGYWATPAARDYKDTPGMSKEREEGRSRVDQTARQVYASLDGSGLFMPPTAKETWMDVTEGLNVQNAGMNTQSALALDLQWMTNTTTKLEAESNTPSLKDGGLLNSDWSEWLMGWPIGWTDLKLLEMDKFQQWQHSHSEFLEGSSND